MGLTDKELLLQAMEAHGWSFESMARSNGWVSPEAARVEARTITELDAHAASLLSDDVIAEHRASNVEPGDWADTALHHFKAAQKDPATIRALAMEEAARSGEKLLGAVDSQGPVFQAILDVIHAIRALAPLPPTLVAVKREVLEEVIAKTAALIEYLNEKHDNGGNDWADEAIGFLVDEAECELTAISKLLDRP